jgi:hypothetical protein
MANNIGTWIVKIEKHAKHFVARLHNHKTQARHVISDPGNYTYDRAMQAAAEWIKSQEDVK